MEGGREDIKKKKIKGRIQEIEHEEEKKGRK